MADENTPPTPGGNAAPPAPPPAPPAGGDDAPDETLSLLFQSVESEAAPPPEAPQRGKTLHEAIDDKAEVPPAPPPPSGGDNPPPAPPASPPPAEDKPIRVKRKDIPPLPEIPAEEAPAPAGAAKDPIEADLLEEEREQLELARLAERRFPDKYAGRAAKTLKFFQDHKEFLAAARKKDPSARFDESNEEYTAWLEANAVRFTRTETENLRTERIREEVSKESDAKLADLQDDIFRNNQEPVIRREADDAIGGMVELGMTDELKEAVKAGGFKKLQEDFPEEYKCACQTLGVAASDIEEFTRLTRKNPKTGRSIVAFDKTNPQHNRIIRFIDITCDEFEREGGAQRMRDGKRFAPRSVINRIPKEKRSGYWTFSNKEIVERAKQTAAASFKQLVAQRHEELQRSGWRREPKQPAPPPAGGGAPTSAPPPPPAAPTSPPAPRPSPIPGAGGGGSDDSPEKMLSLLIGDGP